MNNLRKNHEGYADPTAAATLRKPEPGDIWELNHAKYLIIKNHGGYSSVLTLGKFDRKVCDIVEVETGQALWEVDPARLSYKLHNVLRKCVGTIDPVSFARITNAVRKALGFDEAEVVINATTPAKNNMDGNLIDYTERAKVYTAAQETFGLRNQLVVALEELSEAQKEICKGLRGAGNLDHLAEEVADATIVLEQVRLAFGINATVCRKMDEKVARLRDTIEKERKGWG